MNAQTIISDTAAMYGITPADMTSPCRRREMADARIVASYVMVKHYGVTKSECARLLHRNHADIIHLIRVAGEWLNQPFLNPRGADNIEQLLNQYSNEPGTSRGCNQAAKRRKAVRRGMAGVEKEQAQNLVSGH